MLAMKIRFVYGFDTLLFTSHYSTRQLTLQLVLQKKNNRKCTIRAHEEPHIQPNATNVKTKLAIVLLCSMYSLMDDMKCDGMTV